MLALKPTWLNPVLLSVLAIVAILVLTDTPYDVYFEGAQFVHFMLGPATVALAVPLYKQWDCLRRHPVALSISLILGSLTAVVSAILIAKVFGATMSFEGEDGVVVVAHPVTTEATPEGVGCSFYAAAMAELLRSLTNFDGAMLHDVCMARGDECCRWHTGYNQGG